VDTRQRDLDSPANRLADAVSLPAFAIAIATAVSAAARDASQAYDQPNLPRLGVSSFRACPSLYYPPNLQSGSLNGSPAHIQSSSQSFHPIFGPIILIGYSTLCNVLLITMLISILSNQFAEITENAQAEVGRRRISPHLISLHLSLLPVPLIHIDRDLSPELGYKEGRGVTD
jgi:hypothetical protein